MSNKQWFFKSQTAKSTPFNNENSDFASKNVEDAIKEIGASASPGYSWGRGGNASTGTWLNNEGVSSNRSGRFVFIQSPVLAQIFVANRDVATYTVGVYEHEGNEVNLTLIDTISITSARGGTKSSNISVTQGRQLALRVDAGSGQDIVAGVVLKGVS